MHLKILLPILCLLFWQSQTLTAQNDKGILVITLGTDTTFIQHFEIRDDSFFSKILTLPQGLRLVEGRGAFFPNGNLKSIASTISTLGADGKWAWSQETRLSTTADSTIIRLKQKDDTIFRNFAGQCMVTNSGDAASFQLFPFYGFHAPGKTGDSLVFRHVTLLGARDFVVKRLSKNTVQTRSSLMGPITLTLDRKDRLQSVDALGSSLNFTATVYRDVEFEDLKKHFAQKQLQTGATLVVSTRDTVRFAKGNQRILIDYWRPSARGRKVFGGIIPNNHFWRMGANHATQVTFAQPTIWAGQKLEAGQYTLFAMPSGTDWTLCINRKTGIWGTEYDPAADVLRALMQVESLPKHVEKLTISVSPATGGGVLAVEWEKTRLSATFKNPQ